MSHLVYINGLGPNYKGEHMYEFIFSNRENVNGVNWDSSPAHGQVFPPDLEFIDKVGVLRNINIKFELIQNSDMFGMDDAKNNVIALAWEVEDEIKGKKLVFLFGENEKSVKDKLYSRDIVLEFEKEITYEID